jgi:hypothetical protein
MGQIDGVGLDEALEALREELASAAAIAADKDIQFPVETVTVELKVGVTKSKDGRAGLRVPLIGAELGGSVGGDRETVQTVTLVLSAPVDQEGRPVRVAKASSNRKG